MSSGRSPRPRTPCTVDPNPFGEKWLTLVTQTFRPKVRTETVLVEVFTSVKRSGIRKKKGTILPLLIWILFYWNKIHFFRNRVPEYIYIWYTLYIYTYIKFLRIYVRTDTICLISGDFYTYRIRGLVNLYNVPFTLNSDVYRNSSH